MTWWLSRLAELEHIPSPVQRLASLRNLMRSEKIRSNKTLSAEVSLYLVEILLRQWINDDSGTSGHQRDIYTLDIMKSVKSIFDLRCPALTSSAHDRVVQVLKVLGFEECFPNGFAPLILENTEDRKRSLSFKPIKLVSSRTGPIHEFMKITEHPVEWQLRVFGEFMDRSMDSAPDSRVEFEPDAWQIKVLNAIDKRSSLLVSGKQYELYKST